MSPESYLIAFTIVNGIMLLANIGVLTAAVKLWTEMAKAENIKRIGKV